MLHNAYDCSGLHSLDNQKADLQHQKVPKNPWCLNAFPHCGSAIPIIWGEEGTGRNTDHNNWPLLLPASKSECQ